MHGMYAGWHLTYDAVVQPDHAANLNDIEFLRETLLEVVRMLDMQVVDGPRLHKVELDRRKLESEDDDGGVTGVVVVSTSHVSVHTWPLRERFSFDVFSCREFDWQVVDDFLRDRMNVKKRASHWIVRNWP